MTFTSVWNAAAKQSAVNPICPCTLEPLALNSTFVLEHPSAAIYRPLDIPTGTSLLLTLSPRSAPILKDCANGAPQAWLATAMSGTNLAVIKVSGENYISFENGGASDRLTTAVGDWVTDTCSTAAPVPVSAGARGLLVLAPQPGEGAAYYLSLSIDGSRQVTLPQDIDPAFGTVDLCSDCGLTTCSRLATTPVAASGNVVLVRRPGPPPSDAMYTGTGLLFE